MDSCERNNMLSKFPSVHVSSTRSKGGMIAMTRMHIENCAKVFVWIDTTMNRTLPKLSDTACVSVEKKQCFTMMPVKSRHLGLM